MVIKMFLDNIIFIEEMEIEINKWVEEGVSGFLKKIILVDILF